MRRGYSVVVDTQDMMIMEFQKVCLKFTTQLTFRLDLYLVSKWSVNCDTAGDYGVLKGVLLITGAAGQNRDRC